MFILCTGKVAKTPYLIPYTDTRIYSLEELCYFIHHNIYNVTEEFFQTPLISWLRNEAGQEVLADKLKNMLMEEKIELRDIVVTILCTADYYNEEEIRSLVTIMDNIANLPLYAKKKIKADNYLKYGQYGKAAASYRKLLNGSLAVNFSTEEYGDILHNLGIAHYYVASFSEAERDFKEAYSRNGNKESLKHYLYIVQMDSEERFEEESMAAGLSKDEALDMKLRYQSCQEDENPASLSEHFVEDCMEELRKAFAL